MTRFDGLTKAQEDALAQIALLSDGSGMNPRTLRVLEERGLIVGEDVVVGRDVLGPIVVRKYQMPIQEHMRWCAWCAANVSDGAE